MRHLRIAHVTATFPPYLGGTGNVCYCNARELVRLGHEVHVFTARANGALSEEILEGVNVHRLTPLFRIGNAPLLPGLVNLKKFDLIHLHYPFFGGELSALAACLTHTPLIVTYHQDVHLQGIIGSVERFLRYTVGKATLRSAQRVLFTTQDYGQNSYIMPLLRGRENHIGELPNGVDAETFTPYPAAEDFRQRHLLANEDRVAILIAGLDTPHYFKGVDIFISSLVGLPTNFKAIIIGDGNLRPSYERQASSMGVKERVHFIGRVSADDLPGYYRLADVTVLPSVNTGEAFGLVLLESMACGTPVIASNLPGVRKVVENGVDGYLVKPGNVKDLSAKLQQILSMPEFQRAEMGIAGRRKIEAMYSWPKVVLRLEEIYFSVVSDRSSGGGL